jgi:hypothetical protein
LLWTFWKNEMKASEALASIWRHAGLPVEALQQVRLTGEDPVLPSSFAVGAAAQSTTATARCGNSPRRRTSSCRAWPAF